MMKHLLLVLAIITGCAVADHTGGLSTGNTDAGSRTDGSAAGLDAPSRPIDAAPDAAHVIDAPAGPTQITLTQVSTDTLASGSLACSSSSGTSKQSYYRVFDLAMMGVTSTLSLTSVGFGVQSSDGQTITVNVGTYSQPPGTTLDVGSSSSDDWAAGDVTAIATTTVAVTTSETGTIVSAPITASIPASALLIVEIRSPSGAEFYLGASAGSETTPGFYWSPSCDATPPGTPAELGEGVVPFVITATGNY